MVQKTHPFPLPQWLMLLSVTSRWFCCCCFNIAPIVCIVTEYEQEIPKSHTADQLCLPIELVIQSISDKLKSPPIQTAEFLYIQLICDTVLRRYSAYSKLLSVGLFTNPTIGECLRFLHTDDGATSFVFVERSISTASNPAFAMLATPLCGLLYLSSHATNGSISFQ